MPDMQYFEIPDSSDDAVMRRLRSLPDRDPPGDGWPRLAAELAAGLAQPPRATVGRRSRRVFRQAGLAMAAMLLLALVIPRMDIPRMEPEQPIAVESPEGVTATLVAQSQWLEQLVAAPALAPEAQDSGQVLLDLGLRQRIGEIDSALQDSDHADGDARRRLWQARVDALSQLVQLRWAGRREALHAGIADGVGVQQAMLWSN